jgi:hypothetical protein
MAAVEAAAMETATMETATMETATMEAAVMPAAAEAETDHRSADIGRTVAAIIGAIGSAGGGNERRTHADKDAGRSWRS